MDLPSPRKSARLLKKDEQIRDRHFLFKHDNLAARKSLIFDEIERDGEELKEREGGRRHEGLRLNDFVRGHSRYVKDALHPLEGADYPDYDYCIDDNFIAENLPDDQISTHSSSSPPPMEESDDSEGQEDPLLAFDSDIFDNQLTPPPQMDRSSGGVVYDEAYQFKVEGGQYLNRSSDDGVESIAFHSPASPLRTSAPISNTDFRVNSFHDSSDSGIEDKQKSKTIIESDKDTESQDNVLNEQDKQNKEFCSSQDSDIPNKRVELNKNRPIESDVEESEVDSEDSDLVVKGTKRVGRIIHSSDSLSQSEDELFDDDLLDGPSTSNRSPRQRSNRIRKTQIERRMRQSMLKKENMRARRRVYMRPVVDKTNAKRHAFESLNQNTEIANEREDELNIFLNSSGSLSPGPGIQLNSIGAVNNIVCDVREDGKVILSPMDSHYLDFWMDTQPQNPISVILGQCQRSALQHNCTRYPDGKEVLLYCELLSIEYNDHVPMIMHLQRIYPDPTPVTVQFVAKRIPSFHSPQYTTRYIIKGIGKGTYIQGSSVKRIVRKGEKLDPLEDVLFIDEEHPVDDCITLD